MSSNVFLPYRYAWDALEITVSDIKIDDSKHDTGNIVDPDHCSINIIGMEKEWQVIDITIMVTDPNRQLETVIPREIPADDVRIILVVRNKASRIRNSVDLAKKDKGIWEGNLILRRTDLFKSTELQAQAVLPWSGKPTAGYASKKYERVSGSYIWHLYADSVPALPGGALESEWRNFKEDTNPELNRRADCVWFLDLSDSEKPRLLLNECVPGLRGALEVAQKTGKAARVRNSLIHSIVQAVLNDLAIFCIAQDEGCHLDDLPDWQRKMLLTLARTDAGSSPEVKVEGWLSDWKETGQENAVLRDIGTAIQRHLGLFHSCEHLIKSVEREIGDEQLDES